jgi:quinol monooxygenase YgiN
LYAVIYHYIIPEEKTREYIELEKHAIKIYLENGCVSVEIFRDVNDPERWMEINKFESEEHYKKVTAMLDDDPRISYLFEKLQGILGKARTRPRKIEYRKMI